MSYSDVGTRISLRASDWGPGTQLRVITVRALPSEANIIATFIADYEITLASGRVYVASLRWEPPDSMTASIQAVGDALMAAILAFEGIPHV